MNEEFNSFDCGLVLEGGGLRALYTSGVLDAFIEAGITFPYVIGVSAGSCNGVSFIAKNLHRMRDISINYSSDKRYMSLESMLKNGEYLNSKWIFGELTYDILPLDYDEYEKAGAVFCAVTTNAMTGKSEYFYPSDFRNGCEELRASCALPLATNPVKIGKDYYYDGGIVDSIPLKRAYDDGCRKCVVILTQDESYVKNPVRHAKMITKIMKKYPLIAEAVKNRHNLYNEQKAFVMAEKERGNAFVICPEEPLNCPTLEKDKEKLWRIYNMGYKQGRENAQAVKEFLEL